MFWFDGDWKITQKSVKEDIAKIIYYMRTLSFHRPIYMDENIVNYTQVNGIIVNDRICKENSTLASYHVYEDRFIPNQYMNSWQHINTIGLSWGFNREQKPQDYKSGRDLFNLLCTVTNLGGFTLLNMGPQYDGTLDPNEVQSLNEFSTLIKTL
jgi:alpha-L-fucosidase